MNKYQTNNKEMKKHIIKLTKNNTKLADKIIKHEKTNRTLTKKQNEKYI